MQKCRVIECTDHADPAVFSTIGQHLCNKHYHHYIWYSLDIKYLDGVFDKKGFPAFDVQKSYIGAIHYASMLFEIDKEYPTADFHKEILLSIFEAIIKDLKEQTLYDRMIAVQCFRGAAKSTWISNITVTYAVTSHFIPDSLFPKGSQSYRFVKRLQNISQFIVILMETGGMAEQAIEWQHEELMGNAYITKYFGAVRSEKTTQRLNEKFNTAEIQTMPLPTGKRCRIRGRGSGQSFRGMRTLKVRPRFIIADDIESEENTDTPEARDKLKKWWNRVIKYSCDINNAVAVNIGTKLGLDTVLNRALRNKSTRSTVINVLDSINLDTGKEAWPAKFPRHIVKQMLADAKDSNEELGFWQEMFGIFAEEGLKTFPKDMLQWYDGEYTVINGVPCIVVYSTERWSEATQEYITTTYTPPLIEQINVGQGVDIAISEKKMSDDSVIVVGGKSPGNRIYFHEYLIGKLAESDIYYNLEDVGKHIANRKTQIDQVVTDLTLVKRLGVPDAIIRFYWQYKTTTLCSIEIEGQQEAWLNQLMSKCQANDVYFTINGFKDNRDKVQKAKSILSPHWASYKVFINKRYKDTDVERQFIEFPFANKDDIVDASVAMSRDLLPASLKTLQETGKVEQRFPEYIAKFLQNKEALEHEKQSSQDEMLNRIFNNI